MGLLVLLLARVLPKEVTLESTPPSSPLPGVASVSTGLLNTKACKGSASDQRAKDNERGEP